MVDVYRNLRTGTWSVRERGRVVAHPALVCLEGVRFVVSQPGRERVLRERRKNVHAVVRGTMCPAGQTAPGDYRTAYYNPYEVSSFVDYETREPLYTARYAVLSDDMRVYYLT